MRESRIATGRGRKRSRRRSWEDEGDSRENYRTDYTGMKSASSPLTRGLNFSPTWSSWHRVRTTPLAWTHPNSPTHPLYPDGEKEKKGWLRRIEEERERPIPFSRTIILQWSRRVARSNSSTRRRRADETSAMKLSPALSHSFFFAFSLSPAPPFVTPLLLSPLILRGCRRQKMQEQGGWRGDRREKK